MSVWAVTPRVTPSVTGWTAWRTRARGWSGGTSWRMSYHEPSATTNPAQHPPCTQTVAVRDHTLHRDPLISLWDLSNFTTGMSSNWEERCVIIRATMKVGEQREARAAWWCAFITNQWVIQKKKTCWLHQHCRHHTCTQHQTTYIQYITGLDRFTWLMRGGTDVDIWLYLICMPIFYRFVLLIICPVLSERQISTQKEEI